MLRMAVGHSDDIDVDAALAMVFDECDRGLAGRKPKAALLFVSEGVDQQAIVDAIRLRYPGIELAGSSAVGEMTSVLGLQEDSIALALFAADDVDFTAGLGTELGADPAKAVRQAVKEARAKTSRPTRLCIAMPTIRAANPAEVLGALREALGPDVPILGGGAAPAVASPSQRRASSFAADSVTSDGIAILLMSGALAFSFGVDTGWQPVGAKGIVTRIDGGLVLEIDGRPARDFYERYLGPGEPPIGNPLAVFEEDSDRFYLRSPTGSDSSTGSVAFYGGVPEGATVQLAVAATDEIFEGTRSALNKAIERFPASSHPDAGLVFSCAVRKYILGTRIGREIEMTRELFGQDLPIAGFYCAGEIAPVDVAGVTRFHNETIVAVLLGTS
jgi:hypothetical protein